MTKRIALVDFIIFVLVNLGIQLNAIHFPHLDVVMTVWALTFLTFPIVTFVTQKKHSGKEESINILWLYAIAAFCFIKAYILDGFLH